MKIVRVDNFARETVADQLVTENIGSEREGKIMLEALRSARHGADVEFRGVEHNALDDAVHQARVVQRAMRRLQRTEYHTKSYCLELKKVFGDSQ